MPSHPLEEILNPQTIAVVGASPDATGPFGRLLEGGFKGQIYPVNPKYTEIKGLKTYPSIKDIPGSVDYVISSVAAPMIPAMFQDYSQKGVKAVHIFAGRLSETGRPEAAQLEQEILKTARKYGIRIIGPNCLGLYNSRLGIHFGPDFPKEPGLVGMASETGGGTCDFIYISYLRGVRFSKVISFGNALDLNECDFLDYFTQDPETKIILLYLEGVKDGKKFFNLLQKAASIKPVIIVKGGRGKAGVRAAASHTAALAGSVKIWESVITQAGAVYAQDFEELADITLAFYFLPPVVGPNVAVVGGGGGGSVVGADRCEEEGLEVIPLPIEIREEIKNKGIPIWDWVGNPADTSIMGGSGFTSMDMLDMMAKNKNFDLIIQILHEGPVGGEQMSAGMRNNVKSCIKVKQETSKPILVAAGEKSPGIENHNHWRCTLLSEIRTELTAAGIPWYPSVGRAAKAARKLIDYYQKRAER